MAAIGSLAFGPKAMQGKVAQVITVSSRLFIQQRPSSERSGLRFLAVLVSWQAPLQGLKGSPAKVVLTYRAPSSAMPTQLLTSCLFRPR